MTRCAAPAWAAAPPLLGAGRGHDRRRSSPDQRLMAPPRSHVTNVLDEAWDRRPAPPPGSHQILSATPAPHFQAQQLYPASAVAAMNACISYRRPPARRLIFTDFTRGIRRACAGITFSRPRRRGQSAKPAGSNPRGLYLAGMLPGHALLRRGDQADPGWQSRQPGLLGAPSGKIGFGIRFHPARRRQAR